ncbi:phage tail protein [Desulfosarcina alkanivorans]|uniref:Phage tail protein n=1 Tax=Desulfosarcina alkanivorans TaxID=571177 RepID=A0A5K7YEB3_9BACT|nr:AAA family ATPase [Desulfosarcina alkanivorans]BBO66993.1 phage tail protein [Desulfosarcina alkanivorans]
MDYFTILNLDREPFANSPDPNFFFQSRQHVDCLQKLELALRLKRGLNVVIGAVGAGKTTLCRTLLKKLARDRSIESHLILDPSFPSPAAFLESICTMIAGRKVSGDDAHHCKERIKHHLFQKGVHEDKTVVLIIDEGQKLPEFCLEVLREFLNYETNDHKLLQIVLFAQEEFQDILDRRANLADRVNLIHFLGPMGFADTAEMINFRIRCASGQPRPPRLFTWLALRAIYRATGGFPRKIINLCHQCMLALIVQNRTRVGWGLVRSCMGRSLVRHRRAGRKAWAPVTLALAVAVAMGAVHLFSPGWLPSLSLPEGNPPSAKTGEKHPSTSGMPADTAQPMTAGKPDVSLSPVDEKRVVAGTRIPSPAPQESAAGHEASMAPGNVGEAALSAVREWTADIPLPPPPSLLGALRVKKNDTLGSMVQTVYGDLRSRYFNAVLQANPHIGNADAIRPGDTIAFPAFQIPYKPRPYPLWWIRLGKSESLEAAFRWVRAAEKKESPVMRMISTWSPQAGMEHGIYVSGYFFNRSAAEAMKAELSAEPSVSAEIVSGWPSESILFSDPVLGKGY